MSADVGGRPPVGSSSAVVGRFTYRPAADTWTWSEGVFRLHGFEPGEVVPTTELVMRHVHPEDVDAAWTVREAALKDGKPFAFPHRIRVADGSIRFVVAVGHLDSDAEGVRLVGHMIDVTDSRDLALQAHMDQVVQDFTVHRAVIEQAKGVLMQLFSVDADTAWQLLRAYSQHTNRRLRDVAETLVQAATGDETPSKEHDHVDALRALDAVLSE